MELWVRVAIVGENDEWLNGGGGHAYTTARNAESAKTCKAPATNTKYRHADTLHLRAPLDVMRKTPKHV